MLMQDSLDRHPSHVLPGAESVGIITIEDVIEELLQQASLPARQSPPQAFFLLSSVAAVGPVAHGGSCAGNPPSCSLEARILQTCPASGQTPWATATFAMPYLTGVKAGTPDRWCRWHNASGVAGDCGRDGPVH